MARIETYGNDSNVTLDDKVIGTDALDNSTKNFTVGDMLALASSGTVYTAGTGISIANNVISSTIVDTDTNNFVSNVALNGTSLDFTGTGGAFNSSIALSSIADQTVTIAGTNGIAVTGTYPNFSISGAGVAQTERLILRATLTSMPLAETDLLFAVTGTNVNTNSMHINNSKLSPQLPGPSFEVGSDCVARVALGAYINPQGHAGQVVFKMYEMSSGVAQIAGEASFDMSNQATTVEALTFFSFFNFIAGEQYKFTVQAVSSQAYVISPGTFIEIEII